MSFDLKPVNRVNVMTDVDKLHWTVSRDEVPILLEGRGITLAQWQATFDLTQEPYRYLMDNFGGGKSVLFMIPCFICCTIPAMIQARRTYEEMWVELAQQQAKVYRAYGIQVTPIKEFQYISGGDNMTNVPEFVGLRFTLANAGATATSQVPPNSANVIHHYHATPEAVATPLNDDTAIPVAMATPIVQDQDVPPSKKTNTTYTVTAQAAQQLDQLQALHQAGTLTAQEYQQARARVLEQQKQ